MSLLKVITRIWRKQNCSLRITAFLKSKDAAFHPEGRLHEILEKTDLERKDVVGSEHSWLFNVDEKTLKNTKPLIMEQLLRLQSDDVKLDCYSYVNSDSFL